MIPSAHPRTISTRVAALAGLLLLVAACGGASSAPGPILSTVGSAVDDGGQPVPANGSTGQGPGTGGDAGRTQVLDAARPDLLIIKTGTLELQVKDVAAASAAAATAIGNLGGYVSGSQQSGDGEGLTASVTYRIPSDRWDEALTAIRALSVKVVRESTQTQDVTGQVVDLTARIANLRATEAALQGIMTQATKIADVLAVQAELTKVRGDIEQATAEKAHVQEQASFSTLTATYGLQPTAQVVLSQQKFDPNDQVDRATASLVDILQGVATAGIWFVIVWLPILVVVGGVAVIAYAILRRRSVARPDPRPAIDVAAPPDSGPLPPAGD